LERHLAVFQAVSDTVGDNTSDMAVACDEGYYG
jgi:hypothetical protein